MNYYVDDNNDDDFNPHQNERANWRFSWWDVAGTATAMLSDIAEAVATGLHALAGEFAAAANHQRDARDAAEADMARRIEAAEMQRAYENQEVTS